MISAYLRLTQIENFATRLAKIRRNSRCFKCADTCWTKWTRWHARDGIDVVYSHRPVTRTHVYTRTNAYSHANTQRTYCRWINNGWLRPESSLRRCRHHRRFTQSLRWTRHGPVKLHGGTARHRLRENSLFSVYKHGDDRRRKQNGRDYIREGLI